ncbi:MAG: hypothetical protein HZB29_07030 [Nitrospinae bacterium]|nr:hypothetical protein [Nitrospinota bacterium]
MKFINETEFFNSIKSSGLGLDEDGRSLRFADEDSAIGFDFANLSIPDLSTGVFEAASRESATVERAMVAAAFGVLSALDLFPAMLYASDNEWLDEDLSGLVKGGVVTKEEAAALNVLSGGGRGMDVIILEKDEADTAVKIITPQITALGTTCYAIGAGGRAVFRFSQDDEVSFNTTDAGIYEKAKKHVMSAGDFPFEIIWGEV